MPQNYVFQPETDFLEMEQTNLFSSIRMTAYHTLIRTINNMIQHFESSNNQKPTFQISTFQILHVFLFQTI